jgi:hypothetical protein
MDIVLPDGALPKAPNIASTPSQTTIGSPSASVAVMPSQTLKKLFVETVAPSSNDVSPMARFVKNPGRKELVKEGKASFSALANSFISPNSEMLKEISLEKDQLANTAIFFSCIAVDKCPPQIF